MTAYNFKAQFAVLVAAGEKRQTIRALRKGGRHALPGEALQLYTGMRTKQCRKLRDPDPICYAVHPISFVRVEDGVEVLLKNEPLSASEIEQLASADGFNNAREFLEFFMAEGLPFHGVLIKWHVAGGDRTWPY